MKCLLWLCLLLAALPFAAQGVRPTLTLDHVSRQDLACLWTGPLPLIDREGTTTLEWVERPEPLGYIGKDFRRFYIHITSVARSGSDPLQYALRGRTRTGNNVCTFEGELRIDSIVRRTESEEPDAWGGIFGGWRIYGHYILREDSGQPGAGIFEGVHTLDVAADARGNIYYDTLMLVADGYRNNQWQGTWRSYAIGATKACNWGDFRIPDSGPLDCGSGEFSPADEYLANGWQSLRDAWDRDNTAARAEEARRWWMDY